MDIFFGKVGILNSGKIPNPLPALPSPLPIGAGESASTPSGSDPLQSEEVHSVVNSNFGAAQEVAQPAAQFADQSSAQPETSSEPPR